ncbi:MAG: hypothetical protein ACLTD2_05090 [Ruminococcus sp.]
MAKGSHLQVQSSDDIMDMEYLACRLLGFFEERTILSLISRNAMASEQEPI